MVGPGTVRAQRGPRRFLLAVFLVTLEDGCTFGCPAALLEGELVEHDGTLAVRHDEGFTAPVDWSASNHRVEDHDGGLVVVDWIGTATAREGDRVALGGGERNGAWHTCGGFEVIPAGS